MWASPSSRPSPDSARGCPAHAPRRIPTAGRSGSSDCAACRWLRPDPSTPAQDRPRGGSSGGRRPSPAPLPRSPASPRANPPLSRLTRSRRGARPRAQYCHRQERCVRQTRWRRWRLRCRGQRPEVVGARRRPVEKRPARPRLLHRHGGCARGYSNRGPPTRRKHRPNSLSPVSEPWASVCGKRRNTAWRGELWSAAASLR